ERDEAGRVTLDDLEVQVVGHPERRQQDAHVDPVALHVVEEARRVVVWLEAAHHLRQGLPLLALSGLTLPQGGPGREALGVHVGVDDEPAKLHGSPLTRVVREGAARLALTLLSLSAPRASLPRL